MGYLAEDPDVVEESKFGRLVSSVPIFLINILLASPALPALFIGIVDPGWLRWFLIFLAILLFSIAVVFAASRHFRDKKVEARRTSRFDAAIRKEQEAYREVIDEMNTTIYNLASALHASNKQEREVEFLGVRRSTLEIVRHLLGPQTGIKANLFTVESDNPPRLTAAKWGSAGGKNGETSSREFSPGDITYDNAFNQLARFVENVDMLPDKEKPLRDYKTFATHPVASEDYLYGILTIDASCPGDITELDVELLAFFAGIISATFNADRNSKKISRK